MSVHDNQDPGELQVCGGLALRLFRCDELELLVCGLPHLDFLGLKSAAQYEGGFSPSHPTIADFWDVVMALTFEQKKSFLRFCTGCDRYIHNWSCDAVTCGCCMKCASPYVLNHLLNHLLN